MATILSKNLKVKNGQIIKVQNDNRKEFSNEAKFYYAVWVKSITDEEFCIMFTENEFKKTEKVLGTFENELELGKIYTFWTTRSKPNKFIIKLIHANEDETCVAISTKFFEKLKIRAEKNIEDQPEKSWWTNLLD
jgi:hypothetical protein